MFVSKITQLSVSQKTNLIIRAIVLTVVVAASLIGVAPAFAEPGGGIVGG